jgi:hypothetical protein
VFIFKRNNSELVKFIIMKIKQPKLIVRNYNAITEEITLCIIVELKKVSSNTVFMYNKTAYGV